MFSVGGSSRNLSRLDFAWSLNPKPFALLQLGGVISPISPLPKTLNASNPGPLDPAQYGIQGFGLGAPCSQYPPTLRGVLDGFKVVPPETTIYSVSEKSHGGSLARGGCRLKRRP